MNSMKLSKKLEETVEKRRAVDRLELERKTAEEHLKFQNWVKIQLSNALNVAELAKKTGVPYQSIVVRKEENPEYEQKCNALSTFPAIVKAHRPGFAGHYDTHTRLVNWKSMDEHTRCYFIVAPEKYIGEARNELKTEFEFVHDY